MKPHDSARASGDEAIEATAAAWLAEQDAGLSADEAAAFARWRAADPRHAAALARLENAWGALQQLRDFRPEAQRHPDRDLLKTPPRRRGLIVSFPSAALAAAALVAFGVFGTWRTLRPVPAAEQNYATTADSYERVLLDDGSVLELNGASQVGVRFTADTRRVRLIAGEAHFTVAKNAARPFVVDAGTVAVRAVGTAFNVRFGPGNVEVLVTEGRVAVAVDAGDAAKTGDRKAETRPAPAEVAANERVVVPAAKAVSAAPLQVERVEPEMMQAALAWQGPRLVFVDTPLADAAAQFNRRNRVQLGLADASLAALPIGGSFRAENVDAFVRLLESGGDIVADRSDPARILLRARP